MFRHKFRCTLPSCKKEFTMDFPDNLHKKVDKKCWEMQRDSTNALHTTGCTAAVRWDSWTIKPVLLVAAPVVDPITELRNRYMRTGVHVVRFSDIPANFKNAVRAIIGPPYAGDAYLRGDHQTDPRGAKGGQPASQNTKEYALELGYDPNGRMTRGSYSGVFAYYYSLNHAAAQYSYHLIVDDNNAPYLRGGAQFQLPTP